jgi:hypothetical protein
MLQAEAVRWGGVLKWERDGNRALARSRCPVLGD